MPDRAVCKEDDCGSTVYAADWCWEHYRINRLGGVSKPRAVVALSDDRQWLVVLEHNKQDAVHKERWQVYHYRRHPSSFVNPWHWSSSKGDTGQSAEDVLREFLEGRGDQDHHV